MYHGKPWLLCYLAKTQLTFLAHFVILKLHIWESSLTVRLSNPPYEKTRKYGGEDGTEHVRYRHSSLHHKKGECGCRKENWKELSLMDDFLFNAMLTHPETGEKFTNKILKLLFNREFKNLKVSAQKVYAGMNTDLRGARLDVCIEGDCVSIEGDEIPSVYDVEPDQNNKAKDIAAFPRRSRFYHAIIDSRSSESGEDFGKLKQVYVIFICNYDPFGYDRVLYTIKNRCLEEPEMNYDDGAETIVLYTKGTKGTISEELRQFLNYMENTDQNNAVNEDLKDIQEMVDVSSETGRCHYSI